MRPAGLQELGPLFTWGCRACDGVPATRVHTPTHMDPLTTVAKASWWSLLWGQAPIALALLGHDRRYRAANPVFCRLLAADEPTLCSWPYERIGHPLDLDAELDALVRLSNGAPATSYRRRFTTADGREFAALVHCCTSADGDLLQIVLPTEPGSSPTPGDEHAWVRLAALAATLSHDAAEPIRTASVQLSIVAADRLAPRAASSLAAATGAIQRARLQLRAMTVYARLGRPVLDPHPVPLAELVDRATAELPQGSSLSITCGEGKLRCDAGQVSLALQQLLANAAAFTRSGVPAVARIAISSQADGMRVLSVSDDGCGIPLADQPRLFRIFATAGPRSGHGPGIGLALCRAIAEGHGGQAWLTSQLGEGTSVSLAFPS